MKSKVILISGKKQSGKDTLSKFFVDQNISHRRLRKKHLWCQIALADELKRQLYCFLGNLLGLDIEDIFSEDVLIRQLSNSLYDSDFKELSLFGLRFSNGEEVTGRKAMQWYGQMIKSTFDQLYWVKRVTSRIQGWNKTENPNFIISDCRFRFEIEELDSFLQKEYDVYKVRIKRNITTEVQNEELSRNYYDEDISETDLDEVSDDFFDFVIENNGSLENLKKEAQRINSIIFKKEGIK